MPRGHCRFCKPARCPGEGSENNLGFQLLKIKLFGQTGDLKSAEAALKKLVELNPQEPGYRKLLINFYVEQHRIDDAEKEMRGLAAANPSDSEAALDLVRFLYTIKKSPASRTAGTQCAHQRRGRGLSISDGSGRYGFCRGQPDRRQTAA